jgi:hypothetical protein
MSLFSRIVLFLKTGIFIRKIKTTKCNPEDLKGLPYINYERKDDGNTSANSRKLR